MNDTRRKRIMKLVDQLSDISEELETIRDEEQEYIDNIPENLQSSERYEKAENALDNLDSAWNSIDDILDYLQDACE